MSDSKPVPDVPQDVANALAEAAYLTLLCRPPEPGGVEYWGWVLREGTLSLRDVLEQFIRSDEFRQKLPAFLDHYGLPKPVAPPAPAAPAPKSFTNDVSQNGETWLLMRSMIDRASRHRIVVDAGARGRQRSNSYDLMKQCGWRGLLIEANPRLADSIKEEFAGLDFELVSCAVSDRAGQAVFHIGRNDDVSSLTEAKTASWGEMRGQVTVEMRLLSDILRGNGIPRDFDVLSLDVEGEDFKVLNEVVAAGYRPEWVYIEASRAPEVDPLGSLPLTPQVRTVYEVAGRTKVNILLRLGAGAAAA